jgi:hypothetical protein
MNWFVVAGCVVSMWAVLRIIGNERDTRIQQMDQAAKQAAKDKS